MGETQPQDFGKGLDVGTSFLHFAEKQGQEIVFRTERNAFIDIDRRPFTEAMLTQAQVDYVRIEDKLYIVGNKAIEFANLFDREVRRPLSTGAISPLEGEALLMIETIIRGVVGKPGYEGETLYYSIPGPPLDAQVNLAYHEKTLQAILQKMGYAPQPIDEGLAVIFAELVDHRFTGVGISFGGGMVNVCLAFRSVPVLTFSLGMAGDWIDQQVALAVGEKASLVCALKESTLDLSKQEGRSKIENALSICYDKLIAYVLDNMQSAFVKRIKLPRSPESLPLVLAGGTASPKGFLERFIEALARQKDFPLEIAEARMAKDPFYCVAKGALIAAQSEEEGKERG